MARLSLSFLGAFAVTLDHTPVTGFDADKNRALLAYLAVEAAQPHRRDSLAGLLWPDMPEECQTATSGLQVAQKEKPPEGGFSIQT